MKNLLLYSLSCFLLSNVSNAQTRKVTDERTGVEIIFIAENGMFPYNWYSGDINCKAISLDSSEIVRSTEIIKKALSKYPVDVIKKNLDKVYVLKSLEFYGVAYGGTNAKNKVYIANSGIIANYTNDFIERLFHAEFSSVLLANYPDTFDKKHWVGANDKHFNYSCENGYEALKSGNASEEFNEVYNEKGFLDEYSISTLDNDINAFAKNMFMAKPNFWRVVAQNNKLSMKLELVVNFYHKIDKTFTLDYFKKISAN